jgi:hypothetical protein
MFKTSTMKKCVFLLVVVLAVLFQLSKLFKIRFDGEGLDQAELVNKPRIGHLSNDNLISDYDIQIKIIQEELSTLKMNQAKQQEALTDHIRDLPANSNQLDSSGGRKNIHNDKTSSTKNNNDAESSDHDMSQTAPWRDATLKRRSSHAWPQVDNRIAQSIQEGVGIMPQNVSWVEEKSKDGKLFYIWNSTRYEAPPKGLSTVVTAYYDLSSKHPIHEYTAWFKKMLSATDPMIIFLDHTRSYYYGVDWLEYVKVRKKESCAN